jgi:hypothetical protein
MIHHAFEQHDDARCIIVGGHHFSFRLRVQRSPASISFGKGS